MNKIEKLKRDIHFNEGNENLSEKDNKEVAKGIFKSLKEWEEENKYCFDCKAPNPEWTSVNNSIFLCLKCAGTHRDLRNHIS